MISHEHRCIFVHVRKNAGSSILRSFEPFPDIPDLGYGTDGVRDLDWRTARYPNYVTFAVARNPWSRFISGWRWLCERAHPGAGNLGPEYYRNTPLSVILREAPALLPERCHDRRHLFWSHLDMLEDSGGRFIADVVLRFEQLDEDYRQFCPMIGKPWRGLARRNSGNGRPYWSFYDRDSRAFVCKMFAADIDRFGYTFYH